MQDLIYIVSLLAFFAITALFVVGCDKLIVPDEEALAEEEGGVEETPSLEVFEGSAA